MAILGIAVSKEVGDGAYPRAAPTRTARPHFNSTFLSSLELRILRQYIRSPCATCSASPLPVLPSHHNCPAVGCRSGLSGAAGVRLCASRAPALALAAPRTPGQVFFFSPKGFSPF